MQKSEIIVQVGAEGGSYSLFGFKDEQGWFFSFESLDQSLAMIGEGAVAHRTSATFTNFYEAIEAFSAYSWHRLYPVIVHPEFRDMVRKEVYARCADGIDDDTLCRWSRLLDADDTSTGLLPAKAADGKAMQLKLNIVYVLTNPVMPGLVKIGHTTQADAKIRIDQLFTTGVPVPFDIAFACKVSNAAEVEKALHTAFAPQRINPKREFFQIDPMQAIAILKLLHTEDTTEEVESQPSILDADSVLAGQQVKAKRPNMNFVEMSIAMGAALHSVKGDFTCTVVGPKTVKYEDVEMSLTAATKLMFGIDHSIQPSPHWMWQDKTLKEIYDETYNV
jgi:hypothetical protein